MTQLKWLLAGIKTTYVHPDERMDGRGRGSKQRSLFTFTVIAHAHRSPQRLSPG